MIVGKRRSRTAVRKLSKRNPISLAVSPRSRCEKIMNASANVTGIAPTSLLLPTNANTTHSAIKHEVTTERISQRARALSAIVIV